MIPDVHRWRPLRRIVLRGLRAIGERDTRIAHAWHPHRPMLINLYRHKGYWYHRQARERDLMCSLARLVKPGMRVIEVGGHIGWIAVHLAELVGPTGTVEVFEPSPANLRYLRVNTSTLANVHLIEAAASDRAGIGSFFIEDLTGQNNTFFPDYLPFAKNRSLAFAQANYEEILVPTLRLDDALGSDTRPVGLMKIDVEGAEELVLRGAAAVLERDRPALAIEVTRGREAVLQILRAADYRSYSTALVPVDAATSSQRNFIFLPQRDKLPISIG